MGQKLNPHGLRVRIIKDWDSKWYADDENMDSEDHRQMVKDRNFHKSPAYSFDYSAVKQFIRAVKQHVRGRRLILPRQNC